MRVTREGLLFVGLATALTVVGMVSGNNLLFLVVAPLWSVWLLQWPLGRWNLYGLSARRVLPAELYADQDAPGAWLVVNPRRHVAARDVLVGEGDGNATALAACVGARGSQRVTTRWHFPMRGPARLGEVVLRSSWPFGLVEHRVVVDRPARLLVYPRPLPRSGAARRRRRHGLAEAPRPGGGGDFLGLRRYRDGDSPRAIHWPATARLGRPMVVERAQEAERAVRVVLHDRVGDAWERELARACGEVQQATDRGEAVGLTVPGAADLEPRELPAGRGQAWRRQLLDVLAGLPRREAR